MKSAAHRCFRLLLGISLFAAMACAQAAEPVKFSDALYAKFQHPRCLQCHQFNSRSHNGRAYHSHRSRYLCDNCHTNWITGLPPGEWTAPNERMDWTRMPPRDLCLMIKRNMGARGDANRTLAAHLLQDLRIRWALDNGMTPSGKFPTPPGGSEAWTHEVQAWVEDGMLCE